MRSLLPLATAALLLPGAGFADQVFLKSGGRLEGVVLERGPSRVVLQVGPGQVALPLASVVKIVASRSPLAAFAERTAGLSASDRDAWLDLALWARDQGLETQAHDCFARVLALDPQNALAQAGLGNVLLDGRWVTPEESYRARGYVRFEGAWVLPEERDDTIRERAERRAEARARAESEARIAEAEARARAAEAEARSQSQSGSGIPLGYLAVAGYGPYRSGLGVRGALAPPRLVRPVPAASPQPAPEPTRPATASWGPRPGRQR